MRLTIVVPPAHAEGASHICACAFSAPSQASAANLLTFVADSPRYTDSDNYGYCVASFPAGEEFLFTFMTALSRPVWDTNEVVDLTLATATQSVVLVVREGVTDPPQVNPANILILCGDDPLAVLANAGLTLIPEEA